MRKVISQERQGSSHEAAKCHNRVRMGRRNGLVIPLLVLAAGTAVFSSGVRAAHDEDVFTVDVATDPVNYQQINVDNKPGSPEVFSRGDTFIENGTVYPGNSIARGTPGNSPTDPGSIGKYLLRATCTQSLDQFEKAVAEKDSNQKTAAPEISFGTELFTFADGSTILTDGPWPNAYRSTTRIVLGGTGRFQNVVGQVTEENIGENAALNLGFCNLRVTFHLTQVKPVN
jgi:hypothetical protein